MGGWADKSKARSGQAGATPAVGNGIKPHAEQIEDGSDRALAALNEVDVLGVPPAPSFGG